MIVSKYGIAEWAVNLCDDVEGLKWADEDTID